MNNNIIYIILLAIVLYMMASGTGNAATTAPSAGNCVQALQAQYSAQWAEMNTVQRAMVGLRAASCEGGR